MIQAVKKQSEHSRILEPLPEISHCITRSNIDQYKVIEFPKIADHRGNLTFIENNKHIPFSIKRVYYVYDVPDGAERGGHAHKTLQQFLVAMSGSFDVVVDDGCRKAHYHLSRSNYGLYVGPMAWHEMVNFSSGSVCMALASDFYDESDYYRNYADFLNAVRGDL